MNLSEFRNQYHSIQELAAKSNEKLHFLRNCLNHKSVALGAKLSDFLKIADAADQSNIRLSFYGIDVVVRAELPFSEERLSAFIVAYSLSAVDPKEKELVRYRLDNMGNAFYDGNGQVIQPEDLPRTFWSDVVTALADGKFVLKLS